MELYNSATRKKETFEPKNPDLVTLYTCGPTVYHYAHIGNLRSYLMEDVLERFLRYCDYPVKRVMNITDVGHLTSDGDTGEDKMLAGARREKKSVLDIAKFYTEAFFEDCRKLNIAQPDVVEPATNCVPEYIEIIEKLLEKGNAYLAGGNIYFDTSSVEKYHIFYNHQEDDLEEGVRADVESDDNKRNKADFVLWFTKSKFDDQELKWESPWGIGYPGWHMECTGISLKHLGEDLDIHCGGIDNAFPHHTNEIAQSEAYIGHPWCRFWMHVQHLNTTTGKMAKSRGGSLTVSYLEEQGYHPLAYRFFCLQSHYRKGLVFTWENLDNAVVAYEKLLKKLSNLQDNGESTDQQLIDEQIANFKAVVGNDLNTSMAITLLYNVLKLKCNDATKLALVDSFDRVLALSLLEESRKLKSDFSTGGEKSGEKSAEDVEIQNLVDKRTQAKKDKDFATADALRQELSEKGITVVDTPQGATWSRS